MTEWMDETAKGFERDVVATSENPPTDLNVQDVIVMGVCQDLMI